MIDGEIVAVDSDGKPSFNLPQTFDTASQTILFYAFDLLMLAGCDIRQRPLTERRDLLRELIGGLPEPIRLSETFDVPVDDLPSAWCAKTALRASWRRAAIVFTGQGSGLAIG